jgi:transposase
MTYTPKFLNSEQTLELINDLSSGMSNKDAEAKYGFTSISYAKSKLGLPRRKKLQVSAPVLHKLYVEEGQTIQDIANHLGCSVNAVWKHLDAQGIPRRKQGTRRLPRTQKDS